MEIFASWKLANAVNKGLFPPEFSVKYVQVHHWVGWGRSERNVSVRSTIIEVQNNFSVTIRGNTSGR